jgi:GNAT superfamily N-acetyltransferase
MFANSSEPLGGLLSSTRFHLAQVNIARMRAPLDDPSMEGFRSQLDAVNAVADQSPGFVWRLSTPEGDATAIRAFEEDNVLFNLSVWESIEALHRYVYEGAHLGPLRDRRQWFLPYEGPMLALWWIPAGHVPTVEEAKAKLDELGRNGATASAFTFRSPFPAPEPGPAAQERDQALPRSPFQEASESDLPALTALINEAYAPAEGFLYEGPRITAEAVALKLAHGRFLLAHDEAGAICACVHVTITGDSGYFGLLSVSPAHQGRGLGRALAGAAEALCRAQGCPAVTIDVVNHRRELLPFYASLGYEVVGQRPFDDERLNRPAHFVLMRKALDREGRTAEREGGTAEVGSERP